MVSAGTFFSVRNVPGNGVFLNSVGRNALRNSECGIFSYAAACSGAVPCFAGTWGDMKNLHGSNREGWAHQCVSRVGLSRKLSIEQFQICL